MFKVAINLGATVNCLVTKVFRNIFCFQQKKVTHTGLEQVEGESELMTECSFFWVNSPFRYILHVITY